MNERMNTLIKMKEQTTHNKVLAAILPVYSTKISAHDSQARCLCTQIAHCPIQESRHVNNRPHYPHGTATAPDTGATGDVQDTIAPSSPRHHRHRACRQSKLLLGVATSAGHRPTPNAHVANQSYHQGGQWGWWCKYPPPPRLRLTPENLDPPPPTSKPHPHCDPPLPTVTLTPTAES